MEHQQIDELLRLVDKKPDRHELEGLKQDISHKASKHDLEILQVNFSNFRLETEQKIKGADKDIDEFIETMQNEMNVLKNNLLTSLNKKADYSILDKLNESVAKKVDNESLKSGLAQVKAELALSVETAKNEISIDRAAREAQIKEKLDRADSNADRALDELF